MHPSHKKARPLKADLESAVREALPSYLHDRYRCYPAKRKEGWMEHALARCRSLLDNPEGVFYV